MANSNNAETKVSKKKYYYKSNAAKAEISDSISEFLESSSAKKTAAKSKSERSAAPKRTPRSAQTAPSKKTAEQADTPKRPGRPRKQAGQPAGKKPRRSSKPLHIIPLGGLEEIGKNFTVYEYGDDIIIVDCGMSFPDDDMPGIDLVIPDFTYIVKNRDRIRGLFITHGHEDHIGGVPYLLKQLTVPVYGTRLTLGLIRGKLQEHGLSDNMLRECSPGDTVSAGSFSVEFIHVNHSIPDAVGFAIRCPAGLFVHTGDFKIDTTPIDGQVIDMARFAELGKEGVTALMSDSTNAERPGFTPSESIVGDSFSKLFQRGTKKRIIVATFSSNIHRIQQIIDEAVRCGRKVAVSGRSMVNVVSIAAEMGYLSIPAGVLIDIDLIRKYPPEQLVIVTTGSQGEPMSALSRMASSDHRQVSIGPGDLIIISANPIPGNEKFVTRVINGLMKLGAEVVYEKMYDVHVSGHACAEELKLMMSVTDPKYFIPLHGEYKHLCKHAQLAESMGISCENIMIASLGNDIEISADGMKVAGNVPAGKLLVDGYGVGDVGNIVLRDRKHLAEDGLIVVVLTMDHASGEVVAGPEIVSRGFVYVRESEKLIDDARNIVCYALDGYRGRDWSTLKSKIRDELSHFLYERTKRSPMILPIIMEV